jgi:phosphosulfolactate phosphohydrolase-like enzyme
VACGSKGTSCQEDVAGTELIRSYLEDRVPDDAFIKQIQEQVRSASHAASLREKGHEEDVRFATQVNRHDVVPALQSDLLKPITVHDHEE